MALQEHPLQTQIIVRFKTRTTACAHRIVVLVYAKRLNCTKGTKYYHRSTYTKSSELENEKCKAHPPRTVSQACKPPSGNVGGGGKTLSVLEGDATTSLQLFPHSRDASAFTSRIERALSGVAAMMQKEERRHG